MNIIPHAQVMNGIAISLYDKFEQLGVFVDLVKTDNFPYEYS